MWHASSKCSTLRVQHMRPTLCAGLNCHQLVCFRCLSLFSSSLCSRPCMLDAFDPEAGPEMIIIRNIDGRLIISDRAFIGGLP